MNPFITAYTQSDLFGKGIFWGLFLLSALSWTVLIHKSWLYYNVRKISDEFSALFSEKEPLALQFTKTASAPNPLFEIYKTVKQKTLQIIGKNHFFSPNAETSLSPADLGLIEAEGFATLSVQHKLLEKNLFVLSIISTLGPFLGLLGTVWGILLTFTELHGKANNSAMLAGLSMALATTVVGLLIAIPAFAGYTYLKNASREYARDMENFTQRLISAVELQHRKPDYAQKDPALT